jgi:hypothetical protein
MRTDSGGKRFASLLAAAGACLLIVAVAPGANASARLTTAQLAALADHARASGLPPGLTPEELGLLRDAMAAEAAHDRKTASSRWDKLLHSYIKPANARFGWQLVRHATLETAVLRRPALGPQLKGLATAREPVLLLEEYGRTLSAAKQKALLGGSASVNTLSVSVVGGELKVVQAKKTLSPTQINAELTTQQAALSQWTALFEQEDDDISDEDEAELLALLQAMECVAQRQEVEQMAKMSEAQCKAGSPQACADFMSYLTKLAFWSCP